MRRPTADTVVKHRSRGRTTPDTLHVDARGPPMTYCMFIDDKALSESHDVSDRNRDSEIAVNQ